jgi:hypothetical protein
MQKCYFIIFTLVIILFLAVAAATYGGSSAHYKISAEVLDAGSARGQSSSYLLLGKTRDLSLQTPSSADFTIREGFLRSVYFAHVPFAPIVTSIDPTSASNTQEVSVAIYGANFTAGATAELSLGATKIVATNVTVESTGKITCIFNITGATAGLWDVTVRNTDGKSGTLPSAFTITSLAPAVTSITPNKGDNDGIVNITNLAGFNFKAGAQVKLSKIGESDIIADNVVVVSTSKITCRFDLTGKSTGLWDVVVTNSDLQSGTLAQGFRIEAPGLKVTVPVKSEKNPFDPSTGPTKLTYSLSKDVAITIYIFDMRGERVWDYTAPSGSDGGRVGANDVSWDGVTVYHSFASNGVYFVHVTAKVSGQIKTLSTTKIAVMRF